MSDHEHVHDESCYEEPNWRFSKWEVASIGAAVAGGIFTTLGQGFALLARELTAMANWDRGQYDIALQEMEEAEARREISDAYQRLIYGTTPKPPVDLGDEEGEADG